MLVCGVDLGARSAKILLLDPEAPGGVRHWLADTGHDPARTGRRLLDEALAAWGARPEDVACTIATGYGRAALPFATATVTEITCHARGVRHHFPDVRTIVDIGGQDSKVIALDERGAVSDFAMNDRCAAGTGRFLEIVARILDLDLDQLGEVAAQATRPAAITSMCAVFAESEVVGLLARGTPRQEVLAGVHASIASRIATLAARLRVGPPAVFTGGVAKNPAMVKAVGAALSLELAVPPEPQITGALGAALIAADRARQTP
ncbi:MAG: 2-hydroxyglutaryl-CoA dehydratase [Planctomycetes bacterium]|nr:2-hydroxyglutaryl-CoA dehydratase [Planctomycetota bacterium]